MNTWSSLPEVVDVPGDCRAWLCAVADHLIPASVTMPAAGAAGVGAGQLDVVLHSRPDLVRELLRAWSSTTELGPAEAVDQLRQLDEPAYRAVLLIVAGGYYTNPEVRDLLGYTGQQPRTVQIAEDIDEDLLMRVVERGPRYRQA
ncbi:hypothetical protein [Sciscionella sediminilitoris]|uniref:hypothetical protein n=1 Tax=Sciscionella sediminilitoris TaxID=1445613 RepID=UPI0004DF3068|nr:hypothetical protein [Sciscionella sp. SE31]